jgi:DNA-directed RNA polymerase specialized sigma24 family protein
MTNDADLLGQFIREPATRAGQDAFAALVNRHLNLVYSAALRQVRSPQLAEEISQSVFTQLARHAASLKPGTILAAWLHQVTHHAAIDVLRPMAGARRANKLPAK